jgi:peptidyl-tRNA hydrolase
MRIKILYRKNLRMSPGKLAAQSVHAALLLASETRVNANASVVVLSCSDKKFEESKLNKRVVAVVRDKGLTEVVPGTETCLAFLD